MAEPIQHGDSGQQKSGQGLWSLLVGILWSRFFLYLYDYICMKLPATERYRQLSLETLRCRFCQNEISLLGAWKCECGFSRPGNYYGRCPKCLKHPHYIDCPACKFTMGVR